MFRPADIETFRFIGSPELEPDGTVRLRYGFDDRFVFCEEIKFLAVSEALDPVQKVLLRRLLPLLHLAAGVSYYKAAVPPKIAVEGPVSPAAATFFEALYRHGLGEFAFKNQLSLQNRIRFPASGDQTGAAASDETPLQLTGSGFLVPLGGGKDSLVTVELLRRIGRPISTFILGDFPAIEAVAKLTGCPLIVAKRKLDPLLLQLNREGAYNGHVPISAIFSLTALIAAVLQNIPAVIASQERSAESGNVVYDGIEVNHQYSKSFRFESDLRALLQREVSPQLEYYSLLRPLSEVHIAKLFAGMQHYHPVFTSCNSSFRLSGTGERRWCGNCPKCRFVFLALAPFLSRRELIAILGADLLDDERQLQGFRDVLGLGTMKPFECVGEFEEADWCFRKLLQLNEWRGACVLEALSPELPKLTPEVFVERERSLFALSPKHALPAEMERLLTLAIGQSVIG